MEEYELGIIGGGPTGLFATFCAGLRDIKSVTIEGLDTTGGQILKFYPVKKVLDVEGIPEIIGSDLANSLLKQAKLFGNKIVLNSKVTDIKKNPDGKFSIEVNGEDKYLVKAVLMCTGIGSLVPTKLNVDGESNYEDNGVYYAVNSTGPFAGKTVAVIGGGDSGFDWANQIVGVAKKIFVVEYMPVLKALERSVSDLMKTGKGEVILNTAVKEVINDGKKVIGLKIMDRKDNSIKTLPIDSIIVAIGHKIEINSFKSLKFDVMANKIKVNDDYETSIPGIFAAGDLSVSGNKPKVGLLAVGGAEAYMAVNNLKKYINPEASVFGEHSTNLKV